MCKLFAALFLALTFGLTSCASLEVTPLTTVNEQLAYGYSAVTSIRLSTTQALQAHSITVADAKYILNLTDKIRVLLDSSKVIGSTDTTTALQKLQLANGMLLQLQQYLVTKGVK